MAEISTERLIMRGWRDSDLAPWAAMNAHPEVPQYLGPLLTFEQASASGLPFPGVEPAWRLAGPAWGHGYATEAALAALEYGFDVMGLPEIVAVTMASNLRSRAVMRRIGMTTNPAEDFDDPDVDEGPLRRHVVYRRLRDPKTLRTSLFSAHLDAPVPAALTTC